MSWSSPSSTLRGQEVRVGWEERLRPVQCDRLNSHLFTWLDRADVGGEMMSLRFCLITPCASYPYQMRYRRQRSVLVVALGSSKPEERHDVRLGPGTRSQIRSVCRTDLLPQTLPFSPQRWVLGTPKHLFFELPSPLDIRPPRLERCVPSLKFVPPVAITVNSDDASG